MKKFVITISRGCGSGGSTIGKGVAKRLGISFIDRELLRMASDDSGINEELFAKMDERLKTMPLFKAARKVYKGELLPPDSDDFTSIDNLFNYQAKVLKEMAVEQSYVVIGRCADYVLREFPNVLRVFIHAPIEACIENRRKIHVMSDREIEKLIVKTNKYRSDYYTYHTGNNWKDATNFDLCLNSSDLGYEKCVDLICDYLELKLKD